MGTSLPWLYLSFMFSLYCKYQSFRFAVLYKREDPCCYFVHCCFLKKDKGSKEENMDGSVKDQTTHAIVTRDTTVSIIGNSGREAEPGRRYVDSRTFQAMCAEAERIITQEFGLDMSLVTMVSGDAAVSDHVAVELFEKDPKNRSLLLFLPARWDHQACCMYDTGFRDWNQNPGRIANWKHRSFMDRVGFDSLKRMFFALCFLLLCVLFTLLCMYPTKQLIYRAFFFFF